MVVTREAHATGAGVAVLKAGGNAVDAAVAVGLALAVTHPSAGNLGGGGFMLVRLADGRTTFLDFRERAPERATRDMYLDAAGKPTEDSMVGYRAAGVPGTVAGLEFAHRKYGQQALGGAGRAGGGPGRQGLPGLLAAGAKPARQPAAGPLSGIEAHLSAQRQVLRARRKLVQPELARTLDRIRRRRRQGLLRGRDGAAAGRRDGRPRRPDHRWRT